MLPKTARVYFCQANVPRAMKLNQLELIAGEVFPEAIYIKDVNEAITKAQSMATNNDLVFIGGSTFVVAEINNL